MELWYLWKHASFAVRLEKIGIGGFEVFLFIKINLWKSVRNFNVFIQSLGNQLLNFRIRRFYCGLWNNNELSNRGEEWILAGGYVLLCFYSWVTITIINLFWAILLSDLLILNEPSNFYDRSIVIYILEKSLHTDFVATRKSAVHR